MRKSRSKKITTPEKIPPSRIKYVKNHPTVSARLPIEVRDKLLMTIRIRGITLPKVLTALANGAEIKVPSAGEEKKPGYFEGLNKAKMLYCVFYKCTKCHQLIAISTPEEKEAASNFMSQAGWGHKTCPEPNLPRPNLPRPTPPKPAPPSIVLPKPNPPAVPVAQLNDTQDKLRRFAKGQ